MHYLQLCCHSTSDKGTRTSLGKQLNDGVNCHNTSTGKVETCWSFVIGFSFFFFFGWGVNK